MATFNQWVAGARPHTLPAALAPVAVGTGSAYGLGHADAAVALLALLVAVLLQVGCNYANDYSDGIRGTDKDRVGPVRLVGQRLADPSNVKLAAFGCFGAAGLAGLALIGLSGVWWFFLVGTAAVAAAWFYTGGDKPYGYMGLGELFVFVFFGLVATVCTTYAQVNAVDAATWLGAVAMGCLITAILVVNNLRDIPGDTVSGKMTLAVRIGDRATRALFVGLFVAAYVCALACLPATRWAPVVLLSLPFAVKACAPVLRGAQGRPLVASLAASGTTTLVFGLLLAFALCF